MNLLIIVVMVKGCCAWKIHVNLFQTMPLSNNFAQILTSHQLLSSDAGIRGRCGCHNALQR